MTQEQEELLLKDLCARLPYGVKGLVTFNGNLFMTQVQVEDRTIDGKLYDRFAEFQGSWYDNVTIKPFQKTLDNAIKQRDVVINRLEESKGIYDLELMKLENKRLDIINMTSAPNSSIVLSDFNIDDLTSEFREKIEIKNIDAEVSTRMSTEVESEENTVSNEEINSYYDLL